MSDKMIYVAAPFWHDSEDVREERRKKAISYSFKLTERGILNYSPLLYSEKYRKTKTPESYWLKHGRKMVDTCDALHVLCLSGWRESAGIKGEIARAKERGIQVKYITQCERLAFCGSRTCNGEKTREVIQNAIDEYRPGTIVTHGEPAGACTIAQELARECGVSLKLHFLQKKYAGGKFERRSKDVFIDSDFCVFVHDGKSKGCSNELEMAKKMGVPYKYYRVNEGSKDMINSEREMFDVDFDDLRV